MRALIASSVTIHRIRFPSSFLTNVSGKSLVEKDLVKTAQDILAKAKAERKLPPYTGESVLRGEITGPAIRKQ